MDITSAKNKEAFMGEVEKNKELLMEGDVIRFQFETQNATILSVYEAGFEYKAWDGQIDFAEWSQPGLHGWIVSAFRSFDCLFLNHDNSNYPRWISENTKIMGGLR